MNSVKNRNHVVMSFQPIVRWFTLLQRQFSVCTHAQN